MAIMKSTDIRSLLRKARHEWRFFERAIDQNGEPNSVTIDGSPANLAALHDINTERETPIVVRQVKYLNNIVEQDHRAIKCVTRPMLGFKSLPCASILIGGIELMHMIAKGQMQRRSGAIASATQQFYSLAARAKHHRRPLAD